MINAFDDKMFIMFTPKTPLKFCIKKKLFSFIDGTKYFVDCSTFLSSPATNYE